ncbi:hypothetical protein BIW11_04163 [Tropilaelaps mercedesae]|uniref:Uncharacterized protein n=1 Tax=Tropilaelaps mercedesae TaxID=418985 RepID=A0A1V9XAF4_9ACAR|nr:hypothetical protein BIW11_04163 [Tropilaelaps mercedesae]
MNDATPRSLLKIEQARNMSGAFITTQRISPALEQCSLFCRCSEFLVVVFPSSKVGVCRSIFPDILQRNPHSTPFRHQNCSVLCVYGTSPVEIPEGGMCYQQRNFIGTPGHCRGGRCVISGKPFKFGFTVEGDSAFNPFSRPPLAPGFAPDVHAPRRTAPYSPRKR